jgi:predicted nucleic acid-binding protein
VGEITTLTEQLQQAGSFGIDTSVFIYAFERHPTYGPVAKSIFHTLQAGHCEGIVSTLALGEILTGVKKTQNWEMVQRYREVFRQFPNLSVCDADWLVMEQMSNLRAKYGLPTPDAIHLGTALVHGVETFVTNDARLKHLAEIDVLVLADFA